MASVSLDLKTITIKAEEFVKVVKDNPGASAVTALGLAAGTWAFYRYRTYGVSPLTPVYQEDGVYPVEKKVRCGKISLMVHLVKSAGFIEMQN